VFTFVQNLCLISVNCNWTSDCYSSVRSAPSALNDVDVIGDNEMLMVNAMK
jgi:hypothetical protein